MVNSFAANVEYPLLLFDFAIVQVLRIETVNFEGQSNARITEHIWKSNDNVNLEDQPRNGITENSWKSQQKLKFGEPAKHLNHRKHWKS